MSLVQANFQTSRGLFAETDDKVPPDRGAPRGRGAAAPAAAEAGASESGGGNRSRSGEERPAAAGPTAAGAAKASRGVEQPVVAEAAPLAELAPAAALGALPAEALTTVEAQAESADEASESPPAPRPSPREAAEPADVPAPVAALPLPESRGREERAPGEVAAEGAADSLQGSANEGPGSAEAFAAPTVPPPPQTPPLKQQRGSLLAALLQGEAGGGAKNVESVGAVALIVVLAALVLLMSLVCIAAFAGQPKPIAASSCRVPAPPAQPPAQRTGSAPVVPPRPTEVEDPFHMCSARGPVSSPMSGNLGPGLAQSADPERCLCPDLVVPPNCECILLIPTAPLGQGEFNITDTHGNTVLSVEPRPSVPRASGGASPLAAFSPSGSPMRTGAQAGARAQRLVLNSIYNDLLAQCGPAPNRSDPAEFHLLRASGEHFAKLTCSESRKECMLVTRSGARLHFWGSPADHALNVTSGSGRVCATTEPQTLQRYKLRVAPLMDVGLVLCGILCIDHLA